MSIPVYDGESMIQVYIYTPSTGQADESAINWMMAYETSELKKGHRICLSRCETERLRMHNKAKQEMSITFHTFRVMFDKPRGQDKASLNGKRSGREFQFKKLETVNQSTKTDSKGKNGAKKGKITYCPA